MKQINLLPKQEQRELRLMIFSEQLLMFWVWVFTCLLLFVALTYIAKAYLGRQIADAEGEIAQYSQILKSSDNEILKEQVEGLNSQISGIKNLQSQHYYWTPALIELAKLLPPDISLDSVNMDRVTGKIDLKGTFGSRESALKFWADMHKTDYFKNINFPLKNLERPAEGEFTFSFEVNFAKLTTP